MDEPLIQISAGGTKTYLHHDRNGNIVAKTDNAGALAQAYKYSPWGEIVALSGTTFGFTGQRYDTETGLYYFKLRHYSPGLGRFMQPDPVEYLAGLNMYNFPENDPLNKSDSLGLFDLGPNFTDLNNFLNLPAGTPVLCPAPPVITPPKCPPPPPPVITPPKCPVPPPPPEPSPLPCPPHGESEKICALTCKGGCPPPSAYDPPKPPKKDPKKT